MKKTIATFCLVGAAFAVTACSSSSEMGDRDTAPPYELERTVQRDGKAAPVKVQAAEEVFYKSQQK